MPLFYVCWLNLEEIILSLKNQFLTKNKNINRNLNAVNQENLRDCSKIPKLEQNTVKDQTLPFTPVCNFVRKTTFEEGLKFALSLPTLIEPVLNNQGRKSKVTARIIPTHFWIIQKQVQVCNSVFISGSKFSILENLKGIHGNPKESQDHKPVNLTIKFFNFLKNCTKSSRNETTCIKILKIRVNWHNL